MEQFAIIVTCHTPYLEQLQKCLGAIDAQVPGDVQRILCLDDVPLGWQDDIRGMEDFVWLKPGEDLDEANPPSSPGVAIAAWQIHHGVWGTPAGGRNEATMMAMSEWVIYWDADNVMPKNYFHSVKKKCDEVGEDVGIVYPYIFNSGELTGDPSSGDSRQAFFVDTCSAWRKAAVLGAGRWDTRINSVEDWELSLRVQHVGWKKEPSHVEVHQNWSENRRSKKGEDEFAEDMWLSRPCGIMIPFRGRQDFLKTTIKRLKEVNLPPGAGLTVVDNSGKPGFHRSLLKQVRSVASLFKRVTVIKRDPVDLENFEELHCHVASIYGDMIAATPEALLLSWEDDVNPHGDDCIERLYKLINPNSKVAAVSAAYEGREMPNKAVASLSRETWGKMPAMDRLEDACYEVGMVGGGFTLWSRAALEECPIVGTMPIKEPVPRPGLYLGWDGSVCRRMNAAGWRVRLHGGVKCDHYTG